MIDLNYTVVLQLINFLVLMWLLSKFVFNPVRKFLTAREQRRTSWLKDAQSDSKESEKLQSQYNQMLSEARQKAKAIKDEITAEAQSEAAALVEKARHDAMTQLEKGRENIAREKEQALKMLKKEISTLAEQIVHRVAVG